MLKISTVKIIVLLLCVNIYHVASAAEDIETLKKAIETTKDKKELALIYKQIGDHYVSQDDYKTAADAYLSALSLARDTFSLEERTQLAIYISWGRKLKSAIEELKLILSEDPANLKARIHLARVLSWSGRVDEAIQEADKILKEYPENKDALLVKANALRWKSDFKRAIPFYKKILKKESDFDAQMGLTYAYLSAGNIKTAKENKKLLKPIYPYQEKELKELNEHMDRITRPNLDMRYSYYKDSDDNRLNRYSLGYSFWAANWKLDLNYRHTDAHDNTRTARAEDLTLRTYSKVTESLGVGGGLGFSQMANKGSTDYLTWNIKADVNILNGTAGISIAGDTFTDTAQLIENRIRFTNASLYISQRLTDRLSINGGYSYRDYSDDNNAHDFQLSSVYTIYIKDPTINLGYRFRYLDFKRQSGSGYFDPNNFISHQIFITLYYEKGRLYSYLEPYGGHQSFKRYGSRSRDFFSGVYGTLGYKISKNVLFEINADGGNYAIGTATGFNYYLIGVRLIVSF